MSILVVEALAEGLVFGADKNITTTYADGRTDQKNKRSKVLKWPNDDYLFGFVGAAELDGQSMHEWLATLAKDFQGKQSLEEIAGELKERVQSQRLKDEGTEPASPLIIHIGGFEKNNGFWVPHIWHIGNTHNSGRFGYLDIRKDFFCRERFWHYFEETDPSEIRKVLKVMAKQFNPFWFHQGIDLLTFNILEASVRSSFKLLCEQHPDHDIPKTLDEWAKHIRMQVLMYGAYFEAFHPEGERYVGGGVDIEYLPWPV
jgi:hypothetical protein